MSHEELREYAKTFATARCSGLEGIVVDDVLNRTDAKIERMELIETTEQHVKRYLIATVSRAVIDFYYHCKEKAAERGAGGEVWNGS